MCIRDRLTTFDLETIFFPTLGLDGGVAASDCASDVSIAPGFVGVRALHNVPNPFNPATKIMFETGAAGLVDVQIYDVGGRKVRSLLRESLPGGQHELPWDGRNDSGEPVGSGVYYAKVVSGGQTATRALVLLK